MPTVVATPARSSRSDSDLVCAIQIQARVTSLGGGVVLATALLFVAGAWGMAGRLESSTIAALFGFLALAAFAYLLDGVSERLGLYGETLVHTRLFGGRTAIPLSNIQSMRLVHEGLNQQVGMESVTVRYRNGREERLALGPCWRRRDLESFLHSVEQELGKGALLEEIR